jgi:antitoxin (DNA-binding transcriptional repressor) of toxin-antitoxin stability system
MSANETATASPATAYRNSLRRATPSYDQRSMAEVHMSEAELARDLHTVLERVRGGAEVIVEHEHHPVARITPVRGPGRTLSDAIAIAKTREKERGYAITPDPEFAKDVQSAIDAHREPLDPPAWD